MLHICSFLEQENYVPVICRSFIN